MKYQYMVCGVKVDGTGTDASRHFKRDRAFKRQKYLQNVYDRERLQISAQTFLMHDSGKFDRISEEV